MWRWVLVRWLAAFALGIVGLGASPAWAAADGTPGRSLTTCVLRDAPGLTLARVLAPTAPLDCVTPQHRFGAGDFWVVSNAIRVTSTENQLVIRSSNVWQTRATLYAVYADGKVAHVVTALDNVSRHLELGAVIQRELPLRASPVVRVVWHLEGAANVRGLVLGAAIAPEDDALRYATVMAAIYAGFAGLCLALLVYNLGLWRALGYPFLAYYCVLVSALLAYAASSSGALALWFPSMPGDVRLKCNYLTLAVAGTAALGFIRSFFAWHHRSRILGNALRIAPAAMLVPALLVCLVGPWQLRAIDTGFQLGFLMMLSTLVPILIGAWGRRDDYLWLFAAAWAAPIAQALLRAGSGLHLVQYSFWLDHSTVLTMAFEAIMSSLAISYRLRRLSVERDEARARAVAATLLADTDPLTGLLNRRAFLRQGIGLAGPHHLFLLDIDHFKNVNDTLGHDGGDEVLRIVARALRTAMPAGALVARFGGEEFAMLVRDARHDAADTILERLRGERMPFDISVTASIGVCTGPVASEVDWKRLYRGADRALYDAKAAGRDRTRTGPLVPDLLVRAA